MYFCLKLPSASSWGCELKYNSFTGVFPRGTSASSWGCELKCEYLRAPGGAWWSASSWGCELKYKMLKYPRRFPSRQPLREAVSWNTSVHLRATTSIVSLFVRLWVEILQIRRYRSPDRRQPLREAVSWNAFAPVFFGAVVCQPLREAVSWNIPPSS